MTAAKVMDAIARLPGCAGQAADAVSAYTQVKMKDTPRLLKIPMSECPDKWIPLPRDKWPKSWANIEDPVVRSLNEIYMDIQLLCSIHRARFFCVSNDGRTGNPCHRKTACLCKTSSGRSNCWHLRNGGCSKIAQNPKVRMSRFLETSSTTHKWPKSCLNIEDPVVVLEQNLYGHPLAGLLLEDSSRKFCWTLDCKKYRIGKCLLVHRKQGLFLSVYMDDMKMAGKKQNMVGSHVEEINEKTLILTNQIDVLITCT